MVNARSSNLLGKITVLFAICCCSLSAQAKYGGGTGESNDPYLIYAAEHMNAIGADSNDWEKHFKLMADIDLSGFTATSFNIIGYWVDWDSPYNKPFTGVFDGNGHTISNFTYDSNGVNGIGLFGYVNDPNAEIKNLGLIDHNVDAGVGINVGSLVGNLSGGTVTGCYAEGGSISSFVSYTDYYWGIGGLVGCNRGTISNCCSTASVSGTTNVGGLVGSNLSGIITNCYSTANVYGYVFVGGLVGIGGTITNCCSTVSVSGTTNVGGLVGMGGKITNCCSAGSVSGTTNVGGLVGSGGTISNCYSNVSVTGNRRVGGLVGYREGGTINNCYSTGSVSGDWYVGGLVGDIYEAGITNCNAIAEVSGRYYVGGLVGNTFLGIITNCRATASVSGIRNVGGLVGDTHQGKIYNCYSDGDVSGVACVGGLLGATSPGGIWNCYSASTVSGLECVGGLVGWNHGLIINSYSNGSVAGDSPIGGLVGYSRGYVYNSFWDIRTSGQETSDGGKGLPTSEMLIMNTFTDAGWDFVGETVCGIEDIWFISQGDYPHLWWEGMQVPIKMTPRTLNCRSEGNWVKAHITLPEGFAVADVDHDKPAVLHSFGFQSLPPYVFVNKDKLVEIETAFEREAVCSLVGNWPEELTVAGFLADGNIFLGTSTVRIIHPGMKVIEESASCWLQGDCVYPETDMNRDSLVNLLDYAFLMNSNVEFVSNE